MPDPREFTVKSCSTGEIKSTTGRKNFFGALGKVGDLEVLNDIGLGKVGTGLRTLSKISDSIRTGCGSSPNLIGSIIGGTLDAGVDWVMENVGIAASAIEIVGDFNPGAANAAFGQAKGIFEKVKRGNFKLTDIPNALQDFTNLERLVRGIYTPPGDDERTGLSDVCDASPYAIDLIEYAPKNKFMFVVQLVPNFGYQDLNSLNLSFLVHKSDRPNIKYETEEANYYNFRTKVITKTTFEDINMEFYDDIQNSGGLFHSAYTKAMTPVSNTPFWNQTVTQENSSFDNNAGKIPELDIDVIKSSSSVGNLLAGDKTILQEIRLFHLFEGGKRMNVYKFYNPRIQKFTLDALDMSNGNQGSNIGLNFSYDSMFIATDVSFEKGALALTAKSQTRYGTYPLRYNDAESAVVPPVRETPLPPEPGSSCEPGLDLGGIADNASAIGSTISSGVASASASVGNFFSS